MPVGVCVVYLCFDCYSCLLCATTRVLHLMPGHCQCMSTLSIYLPVVHSFAIPVCLLPPQLAARLSHLPLLAHCPWDCLFMPTRPHTYPPLIAQLPATLLCSSYLPAHLSACSPYLPVCSLAAPARLTSAPASVPACCICLYVYLLHLPARSLYACPFACSLCPPTQRLNFLLVHTLNFSHIDPPASMNLPDYSKDTLRSPT